MSDEPPETSERLWLLPICLGPLILVLLYIVIRMHLQGGALGFASVDDQAMCNLNLQLNSTTAHKVYIGSVGIACLAAFLAGIKKRPDAQRWRKLAYSTTAVAGIIWFVSDLMLALSGTGSACLVQA